MIELFALIGVIAYVIFVCYVSVSLFVLFQFDAEIKWWAWLLLLVWLSAAIGIPMYLLTRS